MKTKFIIILMLLLNFNVFSQTLQESYPKIMYVTAKNGLRVRSEPSTNSNVVRTLYYGEYIQVFSRQNRTVTIDGITNYWYNTSYSNTDGEWIFGGYLSEELPNDLPVIIGYWDDINKERQYYHFGHDYSYAEGYKETGMGLFGTWSLNGNIITVHLKRAMEEHTLDETMDIRLNIIDRNNIQLIFPNNNTVRLRRNRTGW